MLVDAIQDKIRNDQFVTDLEVIEAVTEFLLRQNRASRLSERPKHNNPSTPEGMCAYRGDGGLKCAVGCLIPDEMYSKDFEHNGVESIVAWYMRMNEYDKLLGKFLTQHRVVLGTLQIIHDREEPNNWKKELDNLHNYYASCVV